MALDTYNTCLVACGRSGGQKSRAMLMTECEEKKKDMEIQSDVNLELVKPLGLEYLDKRWKAGYLVPLGLLERKIKGRNFACVAITHEHDSFDMPRS